MAPSGAPERRQLREGLGRGHKAISADGRRRLQKKTSYLLEKPEPDVLRLNMSECVCTAGLIPTFPPQEAETFNKQQRNKPGIQVARSRPANSM